LRVLFSLLTRICSAVFLSLASAALSRFSPLFFFCAIAGSRPHHCSSRLFLIVASRESAALPLVVTTQQTPPSKTFLHLVATSPLSTAFFFSGTFPPSPFLNSAKESFFRARRFLSPFFNLAVSNDLARDHLFCQRPASIGVKSASLQLGSPLRVCFLSQKERGSPRRRCSVSLAPVAGLSSGCSSVFKLSPLPPISHGFLRLSFLPQGRSS